MGSIFRKEINTFFSSLVGYIVIGVFLLTLGWIMWVYPDTSILENEFATLDQLFVGAPLILSFIIPAITMRSFAEEHQIGTIELLTTKPLRDISIIGGKFLAALALVALMLLPTLIYYYSVYQLGSPVGNIDTGGVVGSYIGLLFLSAAFISIGLLCSSLTKNIIVSLILGIFGCLFFYWGFDLISQLPIYYGKGDALIQSLGIEFHYNSLRRGLIDTRDLLYFVAFIGIFLSGTLISFNSRKWMVKGAQQSRSTLIELLAGFAPPILAIVLFSGSIGTAAAAIVGSLIGLLAFALLRAFRNRNASTFHSLVQPLLIIPILASMGILGNFIFTKLDMTDDRRFTLTTPTIRILEAIDEVMDVTVYLGGDLPADYQRLQNNVEELLDDFRSYSGYINYRFEDPLEGDREEQDQAIQAFGKKNMLPVTLQIPGQASTEIRYVFPYAVINYRGKDITINLLENSVPGMNDRAVLSKSVNLLEFKFANAIKKLEAYYRPVITYLTGHDELAPIELASIRKSLYSYYDMGALNLDSLVVISPEIKVLIIPKPRSAFSEKDLFKIDQYVMNGGKILWAIDVMNMSIDSIASRGGAPYIAGENPAAEKIGNLLFKYGLRIRPSNFVFDVESSRIPLQTSVQGNQPKFELFPWFYYPLVSGKTDHPIVNGLDRVNMQFPTVIDTSVGVRTDLQKTVLLSSSKNSRLRPNTHRFSFEEVAIDPKQMDFNAPEQPVAVLLEGTFPSAYRNRVTESMSAGLRQMGSEFREESVPTSMIVITDGDVLRNTFDRRTNQYDPLGFNKFEKYMFSNQDFILNCIEYLVEGAGVLESRSKVIELRLLDTVKAQKEKRFWQLLNIGLPLVFLLLFGLAFNYIRQRRFAT